MTVQILNLHRKRLVALALLETRLDNDNFFKKNNNGGGESKLIFKEL